MAQIRKFGAMLPDELWVHVFSYLDSGETLLDVVPLVCRRWLDLARDPRSWAGVSVRGKVDGLDPSRPRRSARVLLHAPTLRCLNLHCTQRTVGNKERQWPEDHWLVSSLRRCRSVVLEEVRLSDCTWLNLPGSARKAVAELVRRSAPYLRRVHVTLHYRDREQSKPVDEFNALLGSLPDPSVPMIDALVLLKRVEVMHVDVSLKFLKDLGKRSYDGELDSISLPRLKELVIKGNPWDVPTDLIRDLLRAAAPTLEVLKFSETIENWLVPENPGLPAVCKELSRCTRLRELSADRGCVPVLSSLPRLAKLCLYVASPAEVGEALRRVKAALDACVDMPALRRLDFVLAQMIRDDRDGLWREFKSQVARFSRRRPDVAVTRRIKSPCCVFVS